jgi:predicted Rossmann-fold nucleotide-binding protein
VTDGKSETTGLRVLVCGGRNYADEPAFMSAMGKLHRDTPIAEVVTGGATGADTMAALWAGSIGAVLHVIKADWNRHGKAAGPIRNQEMLDRFPPHLVVAFPGGSGTADMIRRSEAAGFEVWRPMEEPYA